MFITSCYISLVHWSLSTIAISILFFLLFFLIYALSISPLHYLSTHLLFFISNTLSSPNYFDYSYHHLTVCASVQITMIFFFSLSFSTHHVSYLLHFILFKLLFILWSFFSHLFFHLVSLINQFNHFLLALSFFILFFYLICFLISLSSV